MVTATSEHKIIRSVSIILFIIAVRFITLPVLPLIDPSESRYALIAREMADSGDWVTPKIWVDGSLVPYFGKPPLYFWFTAKCIQFFGADEFSSRLPSMLSAMLLLLFMVIVLWRYVNRETALLAAILTSSSIAFFVMAGIVALDMTLTLFVTSSVLAFFAFVSEHRSVFKQCWSLLLFTLLGGGFLTKGPVALIMFGIPILLWTLLHRKRETLKVQAWIPGFFLFLIIVVPWFWIAEMKTPGFLKYFFINENLMRYLTKDYGDYYGYGHQYPYGSAIAMMFLAGLPWTLYAPMKLLRNAQKQEIFIFFKDPTVSLFLLGFVGITLLWCFSRQLLVTYLLPAVPLFTICTALLMQRTGDSIVKSQKFASAAVVIYGVVWIAAWPFLSNSDSTKRIMRIAEDKAKQLNLTGRFVVVRKIPYSAYFYGKDRIWPHPEETVAQSVARTLDAGSNNLYIIKKRYLKRLPSELRKKLALVDVSGKWMLFQAEKQL